MRAAIIGGTGTLGQALARELLESGARVAVFSRCELKQKEMAGHFKNDPNLSFWLGDIRDRQSLGRFLSRQDFDVVYHVAALKHVDVLEQNPEESVYTNILGTVNVADAVEAVGVPLCVFSSTDKAVDPINVYGMSKGIAERILFRRNELQQSTRFAVYRWGNVIASRGSAIPQFSEAIRSGAPVKVTDPEMTRFWITIEQAVKFMLATQNEASTSRAMIPPMKSATVRDVLGALVAIHNASGYQVVRIGNRGGEKAHEHIRSQHDPDPLCSRSSGRYTHEQLIELFRGRA